MAKYNNKLTEKICSLIEEDSYTVDEICTIVGISSSTYYYWKTNKSEFLDSIKKAEAVLNSKLLDDCNKSLRRLINGYSTDETKTVYMPGKDGPVIKEQIITTKEVSPNLGAIIHFQTNRSIEWSNKQKVEVSGKDLSAKIIVETINSNTPLASNESEVLV